VKVGGRPAGLTRNGVALDASFALGGVPERVFLRLRRIPRQARSVHARQGMSTVPFEEASGAVQETVLEALRDVLDPEVGLNVVDLGLVYGIETSGRSVRVRLTMTTPACPLGEHIASEARDVIASSLPDHDVEVQLVWDPPWTPARMSDSARRDFGWME
jgi:metal-sulfur cluster biosynthetic enzyme